MYQASVFDELVGLCIMHLPMIKFFFETISNWTNTSFFFSSSLLFTEVIMDKDMYHWTTSNSMALRNVF